MSNAELLRVIYGIPELKAPKFTVNDVYKTLQRAAELKQQGHDVKVSWPRRQMPVIHYSAEPACRG